MKALRSPYCIDQIPTTKAVVVVCVKVFARILDWLIGFAIDSAIDKTRPNTNY